MATVKVAVRVRPFNQRELDLHCHEIIEMEDKKTRIINTKIPISAQDGNLGRERVKEFSYDFSYWSFDPKDEHFVSQEQVFEELGTDVVESAFEGYNACVFAYGQTGSGKTHTMMGSQDAVGLIPRICQRMFDKMKEHKDPGITCRTEISYLEIYNEKVKDLLKNEHKDQTLRVREHPRHGPYVEGLSKHFVMDYSDIHDLMMKGNAMRSTASTNMNDVSSRSHAIFTITFVQAKFDEDTPSETVSKVNLVDLAGSERADITGATGQRLKEGGHINKSLVTLGSVISALADLSSFVTKGKTTFIPYRDSTLTWLLKDSLGGNSKTIMIATISPADVNYGETLSTLRYANRAKNIINKPTINEDPNVKLIRQLRLEIAKLRSQLAKNNNTNCSFVVEKLHANEEKIKELRAAWTERWKETQKILEEQQNLALKKSGVGVILDSDMPHLVGIDDSVFSTGITFYPLKEGITYIGGEDAVQKQDIVLAGLEPEHCRIELIDGQAFLIPIGQSPCYIDTILIDKSTKLTHGCVVMLGKTIMFRYNDPAEAAKLRKEKENGSNLNLSSLSRISFLSWSSPDLARPLENLSYRYETDENGNGNLPKYLLSPSPDTKDRSFLEKIKEEKKSSTFTEKPIGNACAITIATDVDFFEEQLAEEKLKIRNELEKQTEELKLKMEKELIELEELKRQLDKEKNQYHEEYIQTQKQLEIERQCLEQYKRELQCLVQNRSFKYDENHSASLDTNMAVLQNQDDDQDKSNSLDEVDSRHQLIKLELLEKLVPQNDQQKVQKFSANILHEKINSKNEMSFQQKDKFKENHSISPIGLMKESSESPLENMSHNIDKERESLRNIDEQISTSSDMLQDSKHKDCHSEVKPQIEIKKTEISKHSKPELNLDVVYLNEVTNKDMDSSLLSFVKDGITELDNELLVNFESDSDLNNLRTYLRNDIIGLHQNSSLMPVDRIEYLQALTEKYKQMGQELDAKFIQIEESNSSSVHLNHISCLHASLSDISKSTEKLLLELDSKETISSGCSSPSQNSDISLASSLQYHMSSPQMIEQTKTALKFVYDDVYLAIPSFIMLGSGKTQHHEYEIKIMVKNKSWTIYRRYTRFRELHKMMKQKFSMNNSIKIPSKHIFRGKSDEFANERRKQLEQYLHGLLKWCFTAKECPLSSPEIASKELLCDLIPFFRKGMFDSNKLHTG